MTGDHFQRDPAAVDLSPLDPTLDRVAFEARVGAIVRDAVAAHAGRLERAPTAALVTMTRWTWPILAAAAAIVAVAFPVLQRAATIGHAATPASASAVAPAQLGMPASIVALVASPRAPTPADIVAAFDQTWIDGKR